MNQNRASFPKWKVSLVNSLWDRSSVEAAMLRAPIIICTFFVTWGISIWFLDRMRIQYGFVISIKPAQFALLLSTAFFILTFYVFNTSILSSLFGLSVESSICWFYITLFLLYFTPGAEGRSSFFRLIRTIFFPSGVVTFIEVLVADALTSLAKVFKDIAITVVMITAQVRNVQIITYHDNGMIFIALMSSLPYWLRVRQCWVQLLGCSDNASRIPVMLNIIKYLSAFPPIWLGAILHLGFKYPNMTEMIMIASLINSGYSFLWDVIMDWGMLSIQRNGSVKFRQRTLFPWFFYATIISCNFILRFSWLVSQYSVFVKFHSSEIMFMIELGEILRRSVWNILRIEWEIIVQQEKALIGEEEKMLAVEKALL